MDHIRYDLLVRDALRGVVRGVLADIARNGLPGEHHFYVSFDTRAEGVRLSSRLRAQHPQEMTIVLQHQFWDLTVSEIAFEVGLSFGGIPERLHVPFAAIKGFFDPSVQFGLEFQPAGEAEDAADEAETGKPPAKLPAARPRAVSDKGSSAAVPMAQDVAKLEPAKSGLPGEKPAGAKKGKRDAAPEKPAGGAEVVKLDRFRKK
jgi:uncharacterized protein